MERADKFIVTGPETGRYLVGRTPTLGLAGFAATGAWKPATLWQGLEKLANGVLLDIRSHAHHDRLYRLFGLALAGNQLESAVISLATGPDGRIASRGFDVALRATGRVGCGWRDV